VMLTIPTRRARMAKTCHLVGEERSAAPGSRRNRAGLAYATTTALGPSRRSRAVMPARSVAVSEAGSGARHRWPPSATSASAAYTTQACTAARSRRPLSAFAIARPARSECRLSTSAALCSA
jgi:hypothetical protein